MSDILVFLTAVAVLSTAVLMVIWIIRMLMKKSIKIVAILLAICVCSILPITILGKCTTPLKDPTVKEEVNEKPADKHTYGKMFSFQFQGSTASSYVKPFCKQHPNEFYIGSRFRGTPTDLSYLDAVAKYSDSDKIIWGEYYTMTATVTLADYDSQRTRINCKVQSDNIIVGFSVEFRGEFEEAVGLLTEGDEVVFRGRFYDEGCGFTDCELITE